MADPERQQRQLMEGWQALERGDPGSAESIARNLLRRVAHPREPFAVFAHNLLAVSLMQQSRHEEALRVLAVVLERDPSSAGTHLNVGTALVQLHRFEEAAAHFRRAAELEPQLSQAHNNLGHALKKLGRFDDAIESYRQALRVAPSDFEVHNNLGSALAAAGRRGEAVAAYRRSLAANPEYLPALNNLGVALDEMDCSEEAIECFQKVRARDPRNADALTNTGIAYRRMKRIEEAARAFRSAVSLNPDDAEAHAQLGMIYRAQGRHEEAIEHLRKALLLRPDHFEALLHLGAACQECSRLEEAAEHFRKAIALDPGSADAQHNLGIALQRLSRHDEAIARFREALEIMPKHKYTLGALLWSEMMICSWDSWEAETAALRAMIGDGPPVVEPFALTALSEDLGEQRRCAEIFYGDRVKKREPVWKGERYHHDKVQVAYVSADFCDHATAHLMAGLFELHDRSRFEIIGASLGTDDGSAIRERLLRSFDRFFDLRALGDIEAAKLLRDSEVDIIVDLKGYTQESRPGILAHRPAPIQVGYLGFPGTVGADFLDYILVDRFVLPEEDQRFFAEKVVYLPDCYQANDHKRLIADTTPSRAELGLPDHGFVFCCFNNNYKITPAMYSLWMRLLEQVPGSVLWLLEDTAGAHRNLEKEARARGVDPRRLVFAPRIQTDRHLARQRRADLFLDTLPYNAHTTASDALWAGLPLITCPGRTFAARVAGSLLRSVGLPELIATDLRAYEALALRFACNPSDLVEVRAKLARNRSTAPLFDTDRFRRHIESAYATMWDTWQRGEAPRTFAVEPLQ